MWTTKLTFESYPSRATLSTLCLPPTFSNTSKKTRAFSEISRVLAPTGAAVLPVPIVATNTIEYPRPYEFGHIRAPGPDYYDKYKKHFARVELSSSNDFSEEFQVFIYEDRTGWPSAQRPLARPIEGKRHNDIVAVA
jgi:hypothetical protein